MFVEDNIWGKIAQFMCRRKICIPELISTQFQEFVSVLKNLSKEEVAQTQFTFPFSFHKSTFFHLYVTNLQSFISISQIYSISYSIAFFSYHKSSVFHIHFKNSKSSYSFQFFHYHRFWYSGRQSVWDVWLQWRW